MESLTRGDLARRCGVNFETVRYYEQQGLIPEPARTASNYRVYDAEAVQRIRFVKRAQELGFTLKEIRELLALRARPEARCATVRARARAKMDDIDGKIETLQAMRRALARLTKECGGRGPVTRCPILGALDAVDSRRTPSRSRDNQRRRKRRG